MIYLRCFTDLNCDDGYSFTMWLKFLGSEYASEQKGIFSSVGRGKNPVTHGGLVLMTVSGSLALHFKIRGRKRWKPRSGKVQNNTWIHVGGTWAIDGDANLYIDGILNDIYFER